MHNRRKPEFPPTEAEKLALREKGDMYKNLVDLIFQKKKHNDHTKETLIIIGRVVKLNPDFYSLWNYRREILTDLYPNLILIKEEKYDNLELASEELKLTADAIRKNPKSYCAWYHRLWVINRMVVDFDEELKLCKEFLKEDQRNFHCWNYRREIHKILGRDDRQEFLFSTEKIHENFSNYSAFHHRSIFIKTINDINVSSLVEEELKIVESAIFTEPDDQSAWWYLQFLLSWCWKEYVSKSSDINTSNWFSQTLCNQIKVLREFLEIEPNSRWALNSIIFILDLFSSSNLSNFIDETSKNNFKELRNISLSSLISIDPDHKIRYQYLLKNTQSLFIA